MTSLKRNAKRVYIINTNNEWEWNALQPYWSHVLHFFKILVDFELNRIRVNSTRKITMLLLLKKCHWLLVFQMIWYQKNAIIIAKQWPPSASSLGPFISGIPGINRSVNMFLLLIFTFMWVTLKLLEKNLWN